MTPEERRFYNAVLEAARSAATVVVPDEHWHLVKYIPGVIPQRTGNRLQRRAP